MVAVPELVNAGNVHASAADGNVRLDVAAALIATLTGERDSGPNGSWTRLDNGLQVCWAQRTLAFASVDFVQDTWVYPKAFLEDPAAFASVRDITYGGNITALTLVRANTSAANALLRVYRLAGQANFVAGNTVVVNAFAIGRWK